MNQPIQNHFWRPSRAYVGWLLVVNVLTTVVSWWLILLCGTLVYSDGLPPGYVPVVSQIWGFERTWVQLVLLVASLILGAAGIYFVRPLPRFAVIVHITLQNRYVRCVGVVALGLAVLEMSFKELIGTFAG